MNLNRINSEINRQERNKLNENWQKIEQGVSEVDEKIDLTKRTIDILPDLKTGFSSLQYSFAVGERSNPSGYGSSASLTGYNYRHDSELIPVENAQKIIITNKPSAIYKVGIHQFNADGLGVLDNGYQLNTINEITLNPSTRFIRLICARIDGSSFYFNELEDLGVTVEAISSNPFEPVKRNKNARDIMTIKNIIDKRNLLVMSEDFWENANITGTNGSTTLDASYVSGYVANRMRLKKDKAVLIDGFVSVSLRIPVAYYVDLYFYNKDNILRGTAYLRGTENTNPTIRVADDSKRMTVKLYRADGAPVNIYELKELDFSLSFSPQEDFAYSVVDLTKRVKELNVKIPKLNLSDKVRFVGHAGTAAYAPENTVESVKMASLMGMWGVEGDLGITSDNKLVMMHDLTVDRTTDGTGNVSNLTLSQIKGLNIDLGLKSFTNVKVPTLDEWLDACKQYGLFPVIEIKGDGHLTGMADELLTTLKRRNMFDKCLLISFGADCLTYIRSKNKVVHLSYLLQANTSVTVANVDFAKSLGNASINANGTNALTKAMIDMCHNAGISVLAWTINDRALCDNLINLGVDVITTDTLLNLKRNKKHFNYTISTSDKGNSWVVASNQYNNIATVTIDDDWTLTITPEQDVLSALQQFDVPIFAQNNTFFDNNVVTPVVFKQSSGILKMQLLKNGIATKLKEIPANNLKIVMTVEI